MTFEQWLQSRLTAHGFPVGGIDGVIGKLTIAGLKKFQKAKGIPVTGLADTITVQYLRTSSSQSVTRPVDIPSNVIITNTVFPKQKDVQSFYGPVGTNQTGITPPWKMKLAWDKRRFISKMTLHEKVANSALEAMNEIYSIYGDQGIKALGLDLFGGSLNVRKMRGGSSYSMHSWGIAIDFDPERNALNVKAPIARLSRNDVIPFWECWERRGWTSLGRSRDFDWMHVQAARL